MQQSHSPARNETFSNTGCRTLQEINKEVVNCCGEINILIVKHIFKTCRFMFSYGFFSIESVVS
jgi:hypothetical protein